MKKVIYLMLGILLSGCFANTNETLKNNRIDLGEINTNYYADRSVSSLEVPPDLTSPSYDNAFRLSQFVSDIDGNVINLTNKPLETNKNNSKVFSVPSDITVRRIGKRRWLEVDKSAEVVWGLSKQFLKEKGFVIKKSNQKIGVMETDYRENIKPEIPERSMGLVRSLFSSLSEDINYTLPSVDKYKIRVEPISNEKSEVHLSLSTMSEVVDKSLGTERTMWQHKDKDEIMEAEMLLSLMLYLGGDAAEAREKILNAKEERKISVLLDKDINNYAKLIFMLDLADTWDNVSWAISNLDLPLEDKDIKDKSFYINIARTADIGLFSKIFGDEPIRKTFQIQLKQVDINKTEVYFNDVSEENQQATKDFSFEIFKKIKNQF